MRAHIKNLTSPDVQVDLRDKNGVTALQAAAAKHHADVVAEILTRGLPKILTCSITSLHHKPSGYHFDGLAINDCPLLWLAAHQGSAAMVRKFMEYQVT